MTNNQNDSQSEAINIKEFITEALSYKYFYIASFFICLLIAFLVNKFSPTVYQVNSVIGPVEDKRSSMLGSNDLFSGLGALAESRNLENDINSLNSFSLAATTIRNLNLEIGYFAGKNSLFRKPTQVYLGNPYTVSIDKSHIQPINARFEIDILDDQTYRLTASEDEVAYYNYIDNAVVSDKNIFHLDTICRFNETISSFNFKFSIALNKEIYNQQLAKETEFSFVFYHLDQLTKSYLKRLKVEPVSIRSSLINLLFTGENRRLTIDFLNNFIQAYLDDNLSKKNKIALNTIDFIDSQISEISDSLTISESKLRDYRSAHQVTDLSYQGQQALEAMREIENERTTLQVQERYYNYVLDYMEKNQDMSSLSPPSAANVVDPIMNSLVLELFALNSERATILSNNAEKNLFLGQIENKIRLQKQAIIENVKNSLNTLNLTQNELDYREGKLSGEISRLPRTELNMVSMQRQFNLTDQIYTFLLEKKAEAAIAMASNYPDYEILEPARDITASIIAPRSSLNWIIALFMAFMIPTLYIILRNFFNEKITSVRDVERIIGQPVMNLIYKNYYKSESVVKDYPGSSIAESFRNLRSSLFLKFRSEPHKVLMVTSSQPQDGKSFVSSNLAASIASVGHKTVLIDADLRRPTLHEKLKIVNSVGLSNYMVRNVSSKEILRKTDIDNLWFIPAGPILPNSSELIESGVLDELIEELKGNFDYVIIDSTPAGLVADASLMVKYASFILLVCRNEYTRKDVFTDVLNLFQTNNINNFDIVFNDLNLKKSRYGRYDNYYKQ
ncbi:MAG TPA: polysaccharide biosynthesis tyrosine autokinase [Bacteroidales bacterium]|jgi:capsular exopolysaccharide synthesis family protein|nr:polysaccharide biosynthesis tyrosine autokinase [Bacteroidales bacterium]HOG57535.1 polysaccharide biosynthesis tyrosine autokinase [Bacteroidales bacterium]